VRDNQRGKPLPDSRWASVTVPALVMDGWEKPGMDATRKPVTRDRFAERSVPHTRRADTYAEAESACARIGGVLQKLDRGEEEFESCVRNRLSKFLSSRLAGG